MNVLLIGSEASPFAKSGGLGDVLGALPKELKKQGVNVAVMMPLYSTIEETYRRKMERVAEFNVELAWRKKYVGIWKMRHKNIDVYFIDNEEYFQREAYYGFFDDGERFAYFCKACLDALPWIDFKPDILHCNEWQSALIPVYLKTLYGHMPEYSRLKTVFTIHNIEYQGQYDSGLLADLFGLDEKDRGVLDNNGHINLMKGAIVTCDRLTTVSPSYAGELQYGFYGRGLEAIIKENAHKFCGIINGIDQTVFNPKRDPSLVTNYDVKTMELKKQNKKDLQRELLLTENEDVAIIGMITRLVPHKGIDLVIRAFDELMLEPVQFVILASGEVQYEQFFHEKEQQYPERIRFYKGYSEELAHRIYAGADLFLMPSIREPCGLAQMIAARYGTISIVRETGGLRDSIQPYNGETGRGNGVTFKQINAHDMLGAVKRAIEIYYDPMDCKKIITNAMKSNFSWKEGAKAYSTLYNELEKEG